jgi:hypothetical protein
MNFCKCGHQPNDHYLGSGECEYFEDQFPCTCTRYRLKEAAEQL